MKDLEPSAIANHNYHVDDQESLLRRSLCTPGTRVRILADITVWANDTSPESQTVYWLFGSAGSGKSTIAYTVAHQFDVSHQQGHTILGGDFFCSRQFEETRQSSRIVRTIVYQLALRCKPFADALSNSGKFDTIHHSARMQLEALLVGPWQESEEARLADPLNPPHHLIVIDALDEIVGEGGSKFLRDLLDVIKKHRIQGLKIFATSRPDPGLIAHVQSFKDKQFYRLEEVPLEEAQADITTYLEAGLPHFASSSEMEKLVERAAGLFIYASTVVKYLTAHEPPEQNDFLEKLFSNPTSSPRKMFSAIDELYQQILENAFIQFEGSVHSHRLDILHTFICTAERTSVTVVTHLLNKDAATTTIGSVFSQTKVTNNVIHRLHAVLYCENDKVLWYHKSFPDFLFDQTRSGEFWCDPSKQHRRLTDACFSVMKGKLKFNIANIPSSFLFDRDNPTLSNEVGKNIPPVLNYCCRSWSQHLVSIVKGPHQQLAHLLDTLSDFLQLRILFWIEAMNLLDVRGLCDPMLQTARHWLMQVRIMLRIFFYRLILCLVRLQTCREVGQGSVICSLFQRKWFINVDTTSLHICPGDMAARYGRFSKVEEAF